MMSISCFMSSRGWALVLMHKLARELAEKFHYQIRLWHRNSHMPKAGEYLIEAGASLNQIMAQLDAGKTYQRRLTIIEGLRSPGCGVHAQMMLKGDNQPASRGQSVDEAVAMTGKACLGACSSKWK